jgi:hypothetical protein
MCGFEGFYPWMTEREPAAESPQDCCNFVDHQGWLLTAADKKGLTARRRIRQLQDTDLPGADLESRVVGDASACAAWCLSEPNCRSFTYAKPEHPDVRKRNTCWIKASGQLTPVTSSVYFSGTVD